jgi:hypothetical protein
MFSYILLANGETFDFTRGRGIQVLNPSVKLYVMHGSVVPVGVTVLLGLCNPPRRGRGEPGKPGQLYTLVWIPCCDIVSEKL